MNFDRIFRSGTRTREGISRIRSGYNNFQQVIRKSDEDIFFFDIQFSKEDQNWSCGQILQSLIRDMDRDRPYTVFDNGSFESSFLIGFLKEAEIRFGICDGTQNQPYDSELASLFFQKYRIDWPELFCLAQMARREKRPLLCPQFSFRVINVFAGSENDPYWSYVENERFHLFDQFCQEAGIEIIWNWFRCSVDFYQAYFNRDLEKFLKGNAGLSNNVGYDLKALVSSAPCPKAVQFFQVPEEIQKQRCFAKRMAQASYPLHLIYTKLGRESDLNLKYRMFYGS